MNIYIPVEVKNRELHAKVFLAKHLAKRGYKVILGRKNDLNELVPRMPPGVYFGLGAFENFGTFYAMLKRRGFKIVVSEEEGLVTYSDKMYVDMRVSEATLAHVDELFTWGVENQSVLAAAFPQYVNKFQVTGNPRFDLLKQSNWGVYSPEMEDITRKYGRFVLVCTSFSSINHFDRNLDYLKSLIDKKTLRSPESIENFERYRELKKTTFDSFLEAIPRLATMDDSINVVVRPHPSENMDVYREFEDRFLNVHVDARFSVHPWIIKADALVHHYCTTSIEALAAGTPRFALRPQRDPLSEKEIPFGCSVECVSVDELIGQVSECLETGKENWKDKPLGGDYSCYVSNIGANLAAEGIVDRISGLSAARENENDLGGIARSLKTWVANSGYAAKKALRGAVRRGEGSRHYINHKFAHLSLEEVQRILSAFKTGDDRLECRRFAGDFVIIHRSATGSAK